MTFRPQGIISVLQTPFDAEGRVDTEALLRLVEDAIAAGVDGFLAPAVASEVAELAPREREDIVRSVAREAQGRAPLIVGASGDKPQECRRYAALAQEVGAAAYLVAVPAALYAHAADVLSFFREVAAATSLPLVIQDLEWGGPGLSVETLRELKERLPTLAGFKIETLPAGPKSSAVRAAFGEEVFVAGGWAVPQMIEALDRGADAMVPESSMVRAYVAIDRAHRSGDRRRALEVFHDVLPILAFSNQELLTSIAFFKRLLVRKGIFRSARLRATGFTWDRYNERIADELIEHYLELERGLQR